MCRWLAYLGEPIQLETLMYSAEDSFTGQSLHAKTSSHSVNGDGCGLGWYGNRSKPGVYRTIRPAWNSGNLRNLAEQLQSHLFFAHVRATTGSAIQETNCHPFRHKHWLFQHNGSIGEYEKLKQELDMSIAPDLYPLIQGGTDSERMFFLALTYGLMDNPVEALRRMIARIEEIASAHGVENAVTMTIATSDGQTIYVARYSTIGRSPTLFHSKDLDAVEEKDGKLDSIPKRSVILLSEPLDDIADHWEEISEATIVIARNDSIETLPFLKST